MEARELGRLINVAVVHAVRVNAGGDRDALSVDVITTWLA